MQFSKQEEEYWLFPLVMLLYLQLALFSVTALKRRRSKTVIFRPVRLQTAIALAVQSELILWTEKQIVTTDGKQVFLTIWRIKHLFQPTAQTADFTTGT